MAQGFSINGQKQPSLVAQCLAPALAARGKKNESICYGQTKKL